MYACLYRPAEPAWGKRLPRPQVPLPEGPGPNLQLLTLAREFSPRIESHGENVVVLEVDGLTRLFGDTRTLGETLRRSMAEHGIHVHVALAATRVAAIVMAHAQAGLTIVPDGAEPDRLAPLSLHLLAVMGSGSRTGVGYQESDRLRRGRRAAARHDRMAPGLEPLATLRRWGLKTLGELAALPSADLFERLGSPGLALQRLARGQDPRPLVPEGPEERFEASLRLEWPIDAREPLSFVLGRLLESLCRQLERADRGVATLHLRLRLVTRAIHTRTLQLPAPMRDPRVLRTLLMLDLEFHAPPAGIDEVTVAVDPVPGRILRCTLFDRAQPSPERLSTLLARLRALMGQERCGAVALVDTYRPEAFEMRDFTPGSGRGLAGPAAGNRGVDRAAVLRRFRDPVPARVRFEQGRPVRVLTRHRLVAGGRVKACAGPWRTSGQWWEGPADVGSPCHPERRWNRDEWDVALDDGVYRLFRDREYTRWYVEGLLD